MLRVLRVLVSGLLLVSMLAVPAVAGQPARIRLTVEQLPYQCGDGPSDCVKLVATVSNYRPAETVGTFAFYVRAKHNGPEALVNEYVNQFWTYEDGSNVIEINNTPCDPANPYFSFAVLGPTALVSNIVKACH